MQATMWNHYVQWLVQKWIIREIFPYLLTWKPERNKVTYWYLSVRQKVITQGQCLTIIVHKHCVDQCLIMRHLKILHQTWPPLCLPSVYLTSLHVIKFPRLSSSFLHTASDKNWSPMKALEQRYAQHTQLSLGGGLEIKTHFYIDQIYRTC